MCLLQHFFCLFVLLSDQKNTNAPKNERINSETCAWSHACRIVNEFIQTHIYSIYMELLLLLFVLFFARLRSSPNFQWFLNECYWFCSILLIEYDNIVEFWVQKWQLPLRKLPLSIFVLFLLMNFSLVFVGVLRYISCLFGVRSLAHQNSGHTTIFLNICIYIVYKFICQVETDMWLRLID